MRNFTQNNTSVNNKRTYFKAVRNILSVILFLSASLVIAQSQIVTPDVTDEISILGTTYAWVKDRDNTLTLEIQVPEGGRDGDLLVLFLGTSGKKPDEPSGNGGNWTLIGHANKANEDNDDPYGNCSLYAYYKEYTENGGDTVSYTRGNRKFAQMILLRGADTINPVVDKGFKKSVEGSVEIGQDGTFESPSINTEKFGIVLVSIQFDDKVISRKITVDGTEIPTLIYNQRGDDTSVLACGEKTDGNKTGDVKLYWTGNDTRTSQVYGISMTLSLRPQENVTGLSVLSEENSIELENYPNPFVDHTTIQFSLTEASNVNMTLYSLLGAQMPVTTNSTYGSGTHEITLSNNNLKAGVYLLKMNAGIESKQMKIIVK